MKKLFLQKRRRAVGAAGLPATTGLPAGLQAGIEQLSGVSLANVRVHYNSAKPAQLAALAYAQGTDIRVAPGPETHLPHEAWHVVPPQDHVQPGAQPNDGRTDNAPTSEQGAAILGAEPAP